jgi:hypothetical protein
MLDDVLVGILVFGGRIGSYKTDSEFARGP